MKRNDFSITSSFTSHDVTCHLRHHLRYISNYRPSYASHADWKSSYCNHFGVLRKGFLAISPAKINGSKPNLAERKYVKNLAADRVRGAPTRRRRAFLSVHVSLARSTPSERERSPISALNDVILPLIYFIPVVKSFGFLHVHVEGGDRKSGIFGVWGGYFVATATVYTEHHIFTQIAWIISEEVVGVPFVLNDPIDNGPQWGTANPK